MNEPIDRERLIEYIVLMLKRVKYQNVFHIYRILQNMT